MPRQLVHFRNSSNAILDNRRADEARTWISVLRTVQELKKQNEHLNESIEELKQLDIRHEERRRK